MIKPREDQDEFLDVLKALIEECGAANLTLLAPKSLQSRGKTVLSDDLKVHYVTADTVCIIADFDGNYVQYQMNVNLSVT